MLCKRYENELIRLKEEELMKLQMNKSKEFEKDSNQNSGPGGISASGFEETKYDLQLGNSFTYLGTQVAGISRL